MRKVRAFSKVGESVFFEVARSSGESFAFLGMCVHSFSLYLKIWSFESSRRVLFSQGVVACRTERTVR